jgi:hypothetical protein
MYLTETLQPTSEDLSLLSTNSVTSVIMESPDCNDGVNLLFPQNSENSNAEIVGSMTAAEDHRRLPLHAQHGSPSTSAFPLLSMYATYETSSKVDLWSF